MKLLPLLFAFVLLSFAHPLKDCGDGKTYSSEKQTKNDNRFEKFEKIQSVPEYKGGKKKFDKFLTKHLRIRKKGKNLIFNFNYQFTVTCDGSIKNFKPLGNSKFSNLTNMKEVIKLTEGSWTPATKDGKPVNCVYFGKKFIAGSKMKAVN